jgi:hypothetical protein
MNSREINRSIKQSEKELREVLQAHLINPLNVRLNKLQIKAAKDIVNCLKNEKLDDQEAYLCKAEVEKQWLDK